MDSLPWPGQQQKGPPAWMLEDERPAAATVPKPPPLSAYEQEWNTLRPQVHNPWHTLDKQDQKLIIEPLDDHHKTTLTDAMPARPAPPQPDAFIMGRLLPQRTHPAHPPALDKWDFPGTKTPGPDSAPLLAPGPHDLRPHLFPGTGSSGKPEHLFPTPDKTFPGPGLIESPSPQPIASRLKQDLPLLPRLDEGSGKPGSKSQARKEELPRARQEFHRNIQDFQKQHESPPGPLLAAPSSPSSAQPPPEAPASPAQGSPPRP